MPRKIIALLVLISLLLSLSGCGLFRKSQDETNLESSPDVAEQVQSNMRKTVFYFVNESDLLVPVTREIPWVEGIGRAALESLVDTPELRAELAEKGLKPSLPAGTQIIGMTIRDGLAKVDFNENFLNNDSKIAEYNAIQSVVYTLGEFPTVDRVQILVNGKPLKKCPHGTELGDVLYPEKINLEPTNNPLSGAVPVTLFFKSYSSDGNYSYFVPVTRMVPQSDDLIKTAVEELIKGPSPEMDLVATLPQDAKVLDVIRDESHVIVNFSKEIEGYGGGLDAEQTLVDSVVLTVSQFPGVSQVSLQVEGESGVLPEGTLLENPIMKPVHINPQNL